MEQEQTPSPAVENVSSENAFPSQQSVDRSMTPVVSIVVIVLLLAGTAFYMLSNKPDVVVSTGTVEIVTVPKEAPDALTAEQDTATAALATQGTSDDLDAIEADLNATNLDVVSTYMDEI